ncbi:MAG: ribulokinase [Clostridia bacterium]|nr:ribulokinase [Clostridia bacterium]
MAKYSIGLDFGTLSARGVMVDVTSGEIVATAQYAYPHQIMSHLPDGTPLPPASAYAHPEDYIEGMQKIIRQMTQEMPPEGEVVSLGIDSATSSVIPLSANGAPLCFLPEFKDHAHAYIKLWKHHTPTLQAARLQQAALRRGERFLSDCGNMVSVESFFPKVLETFEEDREVYDAAALFLEVGEWLTLVLTGKVVAGETFACFKRFYHPFRGYPEKDYFNSVAPDFGTVLSKLRGKMLPVGAKAGELHERTASALGLPAGIAVSSPQLDAHTAMAAVGGKPGDMVCVMGTNGISLMCSHSDSGLEGISSTSSHCFLPDTYGHEGGQSSVGDTFAWFVNNFVPPEYHDNALEQEMSLHQYLSSLASEKKPGESGLMALNWLAGVRTPYMDYSLNGTLVGMTLQTKPEDIYRALIEATLYSARQIRDIFKNHGHTVSRCFLAGGIPRKNELFCQLAADILGVDVHACTFEDTCALGSAILAAFAWGEEKREILINNMRCKDIKDYYPDFAARDTYDKLYAEYMRLGNIMKEHNSVMRTVTRIKEEMK